MADGYDVFAVTDASGGVSREAHEMAVLRMVQAGAVPITWLAVLSEWQRDWAREATLSGVAEVVSAHGGGSAVAFAWEQQLLRAPRAWDLSANPVASSASRGIGALMWLHRLFADPDLATRPQPIPPNLPQFTSIGLVTSEFVAKPALAEWDARFARPLVQ